MQESTCVQRLMYDHSWGIGLQLYQKAGQTPCIAIMYTFKKSTCLSVSLFTVGSVVLYLTSRPKRRSLCFSLCMSGKGFC